MKTGQPGTVKMGPAQDSEDGDSPGKVKTKPGRDSEDGASQDSEDGATGTVKTASWDSEDRDSEDGASQESEDGASPGTVRTGSAEDS